MGTETTFRVVQDGGPESRPVLVVSVKPLKTAEEELCHHLVSREVHDNYWKQQGNDLRSAYSYGFYIPRDQHDLEAGYHETVNRFFGDLDPKTGRLEITVMIDDMAGRDAVGRFIMDVVDALADDSGHTSNEIFREEVRSPARRRDILSRLSAAAEMVRGQGFDA